jgi:hypothetical protein
VVSGCSRVSGGDNGDHDYDDIVYSNFTAVHIVFSPHFNIHNNVAKMLHQQIAVKSELVIE